MRGWVCDCILDLEAMVSLGIPFSVVLCHWRGSMSWSLGALYYYHGRRRALLSLFLFFFCFLFTLGTKVNACAPNMA